MSTRTYVKSLLISALAIMGAGGLLLHTRIHPITKLPCNWIPLACGVLSIVVIPLLFSSRKTLSYGYVLNGFMVIIGAITMAHFSLVNWPNPTTLDAILFKTTLADILILSGKFLVGKALFDLELHGYDPNLAKKGVSWRYPNLGWWWVHFITISVIYWLGNLLWR